MSGIIPANSYLIPPPAGPHTTETEETPYSGGTDAGEMLDKLLSNDHIPKRLKDDLWVLCSRSLKLTFIDEKMARELKIRYRLLINTLIESIPKSEYEEILEIDLISMGSEHLANIGRGKGNGRLNEREIQGTNTTANFSERPIAPASPSKPFFARLMGK